ncbi:hypothetical protein PUV54_13305 [Hyphococcus flavus]|uniref:Uncharacterized protein n=1 Tax=Hyphococcus flavus TaxID=1866326 RepID=A0AAE9ZBE0_9PROT|nr:hypothetical protein [Hyphococcus flavus]WDI30931.1 hypothetical protein PUV54_13305 [Hyphococcus flavus]
MNTVRQILSLLAGLFGLMFLAGGIALSNAVGDFEFVDQELTELLSLFVDTASVVTMADQGAMVLFLSGVISLAIAWWAWPRRL